MDTDEKKKAITGKTFSGACRHICKDKNWAVILKSEGIPDYDHRLMAEDFETPRQLRPGLQKAVFYGILIFFPGEKVDNITMVEIAEKYLDELAG